MENYLIKKDNMRRSNEKYELKNEILLKKKINLLSRLSLAKSPTLVESNFIKNKKYEKSERQINKKNKIKLATELISKKKKVDYYINQKNININNNYQEIKEKNIKFEKNKDDKKRILGQIITDFSSNRKLNNNIFDDGNRLTFNQKENNIYVNDNTINNDITNNINKEKDLNDLKKNFEKTNSIKEIKLKNYNINNNIKETMKLSISSSRGNFYKKRPFYFIGINNIIDNNKNKEIEIDNKNNKKRSIITSSINNLNSENIIENIRKRNKNYSQINSMTYNDNDKIMYNKNEEIKDNNKINNINNINNNISLNNRYNFYIKIDKNNKIDINKDNKDINCEIKLSSPIGQEKEDNSPHFIKKLIVECDLDKINKNIISKKENKKEINVNIKPLYKKIEIEKILSPNDIVKGNKNIINERAKSNTNHSYNSKSFKFLVHQAYNNKDLCTSFNRYYNSGQALKGRSLSIKDNKNDSFNDSNLITDGLINNESNNKSFGLKYCRSEKKDINKNGEKIKKYKNFYKSFKIIGRIRKKDNISFEENSNDKIIENNDNKEKTNNLESNNIENKMNNMELTPVSISISNINDDYINNKIDNTANENKRELNLNKKKEMEIHKMVNSMEGFENQMNIPNIESRIIHSKINSSFSTDNSNLNSISSAYINNSTNNNLTSNIKNVSTISSSISNNLSVPFINLEILYVLEEKLKIIIEKVKNDKRCSKESYDFINYYFTHNFYNEELRLFKSGQNRKIINNYIKNGLLCFFLCYDISFNEDYKQTEILIKSIFNLLHKNFLLFLALVISNYKNKDNNIIILLNKIVKDNLLNDNLNDDNNIDYKNIDENKYIRIIENNLIKLIDYYKMIIDNIYIKYLKEKNKYIQFFDNLNFINPNSLNKDKLDILIANFFVQSYKSTFEYNYDLLKKFFYSFLYFKQCSNKNNNSNKNEFSPKEIKIKNIILDKNNHYLLPKIKNNKYTLVLDLDETLVYNQSNLLYNLNNNIYNNNVYSHRNSIILRPGLFEFLHEMKLLYELVIFSSGTPDYVDPIVKIIEKDEKFFDYILYRQHITTDENGDNIKDLNLIGRDLKKVIIIDDISKYFKLHKRNGICIKPFCGNILSDRKTLKSLKRILQQIRFDADKTKDIRISLEKYKHLLYPIVCNNDKLS